MDNVDRYRFFPYFDDSILIVWENHKNQIIEIHASEFVAETFPLLFHFFLKVCILLLLDFFVYISIHCELPSTIVLLKGHIIDILYMRACDRATKFVCKWAHLCCVDQDIYIEFRDCQNFWILFLNIVRFLLSRMVILISNCELGIV